MSSTTIFRTSCGSVLVVLHEILLLQSTSYFFVLLFKLSVRNNLNLKKDNTPILTGRGRPLRFGRSMMKGHCPACLLIFAYVWVC
jgi:hypothetical protein